VWLLWCCTTLSATLLLRLLLLRLLLLLLLLRQPQCAVAAVLVLVCSELWQHMGLALVQEGPSTLSLEPMAITEAELRECKQGFQRVRSHEAAAMTLTEMIGACHPSRLHVFTSSRLHVFTSSRLHEDVKT
jgi:hypothetical protein